MQYIGSVISAPVPINLSTLELPLLGRIEAGFPSPATDFIEAPIDLARLLNKRPTVTYTFRVKGNSMAPTIIDGAILVVDKSIKPGHNHIVIANVNGGFVVKRLYTKDGFVSLLPDNPDFSPIVIEPDLGLEIFGVVTWILHQS